MSKEYLEALEKLLDGYSKGMAGRSYYDTIKQALQRLESIDNSKPSETLEILDDFKNGLVNKETGMIMFNQVWFKNQIDTIKQALLKAQENEKVLEIIKKKRIDIGLLKHCEYHTEYNVEIAEHNDELKTYQDWWYRKELTKEEFDLLKRWLGNE